MADTFEVFDVVSVSRPRINVSENMVHRLYVCKKRYDTEVRRGMETAVKAYSQLRVDIGRCAFSMNGRRTESAVSVMPLSLVRYCTQAVMAYPIEAIAAPGVIVAELPLVTPMRVDAHDREVNIEKRLRIMIGSMYYPITIRVGVSLDDPIVTIEYETAMAVRTMEEAFVVESCV